MLSLFLIFLLGCFVARLPSTLASMSRQGSVLDSIAEVFVMIDHLYVEKPDAEKLRQGAINGMLEALDDPYSEFIPENDAAEFSKHMTGQFVGIGCQVEMRDGWLTVVSPIEDSPAYAAGVLANDRISKIEETTTLGKSVDDCIKLLTGEPKTPVNILVQRDGKEIPFTIVRDKIVSKSVRGYMRLPDGTGHWDFVIDPSKKIAYVRLSQFTPTSATELAGALRAASETAGGELGGLILDLRNNPGGYMQAAIDIVDLFVDDAVVMSVRGRDERGSEEFRAESGGVGGMSTPSYPIVVMINRNSASASEIVAGSLQDHGRAVVLGERSFGKGLVQTVHPLASSGKSQVKFTTQRYYLPSGRLIQRTDSSSQWGVDPTPGFYVPMSDQESLAWILHRRDQDILRKDTVPADFGQQAWNDPSWIEREGKDRQLAAAMRGLHERFGKGEWVKVASEQDQHGAIAEGELKALERARTRMTREFVRLEKRIETLESIAATGKTPAAKDFWPDALDLTGGHVSVMDKDGKAIAKLKITGRDLERWLENADVEVEGADALPSGSTQSEPGEVK